MNSSNIETHTDLVLIGSGHAHVQVLKSFAMKPEPGVRLTLIAKEIEAPYSGMLPGFVAGHYSHDQIHIDILKLARFANARLIHGEVTGIDRVNRRVEIRGRPSLAYDLLTIDVGITPELSGIAGAEQHGIPVKPVSTFGRRWLELRRRALMPGGPRKITVVGGGAAGLEIVLAVAHRLRNDSAAAGLDPTVFSFRLISGTELLPSHGPKARALARAALAKRNVALIEEQSVVEVGKDFLRLADGRRLEADAVLITTKAVPTAWFRSSGFTCTQEGFLALRETLQVRDDDDIFAAGDCGTVIEHPRPKAGVFAVRQGPPLTENLRLRARKLPAKAFVPQKQFLTILSLGDHDAIAARGPFTFAGRWVWRWKDHIDRQFMKKFQDLPFMLEEESGGMRCGGCAAKVGPGPLAEALQRLGIRDRDGVIGVGARDDAAVLDLGGDALRAESVDFFRAFWPDPYVFGEIAANHAVGDIYAMGGTPDHALAIAVLPIARPRLVAEDLYQLLAGARARLEADGVVLVGGHSSEGQEMSAGFAVSGAVSRTRVLRRSGLQKGNVLILSKPLGTGVMLAGEMRGAARATDVFAVVSEMRRSLQLDAKILIAHGATAMTDVTGFGLCGHLAEMLTASSLAAEIDPDAVPIYEGALALAAQGISSTLLPMNRSVFEQTMDLENLKPAILTLLLDPQTAGGLLAGVPAANAEECVRDLRRQGCSRASAIGVVCSMAEGKPLVRVGWKGLEQVVAQAGLPAAAM